MTMKNILTKQVQHKPVLKTRNYILFIAFEYIIGSLIRILPGCVWGMGRGRKGVTF